MMYFLDFDRTLFDTDAFNRSLADLPACVGIRDEILWVAKTPLGPLGSDDPVRKSAWSKVSSLMQSGAISFKPGELARFVYADVPEVLRALGNEAIVVTHGEVGRQRMKIESALAGIVRQTVLYVGDASLKAEYLKTWPGYQEGPALFADDRPKELEALAIAFPQMKLLEMRRDGGTGDGRWPVIHSLAELP